MSIADSTNYVWVGHKKQRKTTACVFTPSCTVRVYADSADNEGHTQVAVQLEPIERTDDDGHILQNMVVDLGAPDSDRARRPDTNAMSARVRIVKLSAEETEPGKLRDHAMARMPLSLLKELTEALPNESCFPQSSWCAPSRAISSTG
jgi:hypothetical protein